MTERFNKIWEPAVTEILMTRDEEESNIGSLLGSVSTPRQQRRGEHPLHDGYEHAAVEYYICIIPDFIGTAC